MICRDHSVATGQSSYGCSGEEHHPDGHQRVALNFALIEMVSKSAALRRPGASRTEEQLSLKVRAESPAESDLVSSSVYPKLRAFQTLISRLAP